MVLMSTGRPHLVASINLSKPLACRRYSFACSICPDRFASKAGKARLYLVTKNGVVGEACETAVKAI